MLVNNHKMQALAYAFPGRPYPRMDSGKPGKPLDEREAYGMVLRRARNLLGISQDAAGDRARNSPEEKGLSQQTWAQIEKGARNIDVGELDMLARAVGLDRETLDEEVGKLIGRRPGRKASVAPIHVSQELAVRGRIQAGAWLEVQDLDQDQPRRVPAAFDPRFPRDAQFLLDVSGDSVDQLRIFDGDLVHCVDVRAIGYTPVTDDIVVVERTRFHGAEREVTLKQIEVTPEGPIFWPRSSNPRWREPVDWREGVERPENIEVQVTGLVLTSIRQFRRP